MTPPMTLPAAPTQVPVTPHAAKPTALGAETSAAPPPIIGPQAVTQTRATKTTRPAETPRNRREGPLPDTTETAPAVPQRAAGPRPRLAAYEALWRALAGPPDPQIDIRR